MTGGGVPFAGRAEARVDIGFALGDDTELQRRSCGQAFLDRMAREFGLAKKQTGYDVRLLRARYRGLFALIGLATILTSLALGRP